MVQWTIWTFEPWHLGSTASRGHACADEGQAKPQMDRIWLIKYIHYKNRRPFMEYSEYNILYCRSRGPRVQDLTKLFTKFWQGWFSINIKVPVSTGAIPFQFLLWYWEVQPACINPTNKYRCTGRAHTLWPLQIHFPLSSMMGNPCCISVYRSVCLWACHPINKECDWKSGSYSSRIMRVFHTFPVFESGSLRFPILESWKPYVFCLITCFISVKVNGINVKSIC